MTERRARQPPAEAVNPAPAHTTSATPITTKNFTGLGQQERDEALGWWMRELEKGMCGAPIHWQAGPQQRPCLE